jgi:hypothetical protein
MTESIVIPAQVTGPNAPAAPPAPAGDRPAWLPEKFKTPEDLVKGYSELEKQFSSRTPTGQNSDKPAQAQSEQKPVDEQTQTTEAAPTPSPVADMQAFRQEYTEKGALSEDTYGKLAKLGFDKDTVDTYVAGQKALATNHVSEIQSAAGTVENYSNMIKWAQTALSPTEIAAFNSTVTSGKTAEAKLAVAGLHSRFVEANGSNPSLLDGSNGPPPGADTFKSTAEVTAAIRDPRYAKDSAYRAGVEAKIQRSNVFNRKPRAA